MAYFNRAQVTGRPLDIPVQAFTAILYAKLYGHSRKRAEELFDERIVLEAYLTALSLPIPRAWAACDMKPTGTHA